MYSNYKNSLQQIAQRIGDIEQEAEEHKCVFPPLGLPLLFPGSGLCPHVTFVML